MEPVVLAAGDGGSHLGVLLAELGFILFGLATLARVARRLKVPVIPLLIIAAACLADGHFGRAPAPMHAHAPDESGADG